MKNEKEVSNNNVNPQIDTQVAKSSFEKLSDFFQRDIKSWHDLYEQRTSFSDGKSLASWPHLFGLEEERIVHVSYDDSLGTEQRDLVRMMGKRRLLVSLKHHACSPDRDPKEMMKLQCTHAQLVVRSEDKVLTLNNPQGYEKGLFGVPNYPMIFLALEFPEGFSEKEILDYENNIINWASILNTFSTFPEDNTYNGGDPLITNSTKGFMKYGTLALRALYGSSDAIEEMARNENALYCAELLFAAICLGIQYPLNSTFVPPELFEGINERIVDKKFLRNNGNPQIATLNLIPASEELKPLVMRNDSSNTDSYFDPNLAFRPMLFSDVITNFIKYSVPRKPLGESSGFYQYELLQLSKAFINSYLPPETLAEGSDFSELLKKLEAVLIEDHGDYESFKVALHPILNVINAQVEKVSNAGNTFFPPHALLVRAIENIQYKKRRGALGLSYFAHGIHKDFL